MSARLMVCMLFLGASLPAFARDAVAEGTVDGACPPAASAHQTGPHESGTTRRAPAGGSASTTRPAATGGGDAEGPVRGPRWHSFLPGMFR